MPQPLCIHSPSSCPVADDDHGTGTSGDSPVVLGLASDNHFAGVDALRGYAAVAVVLLHACVPYARPGMAGLSWSVSTETTSGPITALFWAIEIVIMPIFLVIAGFFMARSLTSRGAWVTTRSRMRRLGKPLLLAVVFLLPIEFYIWMLGWFAEGQVSFREIRRLKFTGDVDRFLWGLSHLWFLPYLISYIAVVGLAWSAISRGCHERVARWSLRGCFLIAVVCLTMRPEIVWGFQHAFLPVFSKWVYSGAFFAAGVFWFRFDPDFSKLCQQSTRILGPAILSTVFALVMGIWWLNAIGEPSQWIAGGWANRSAGVWADRVAEALPVGSFVMRLSLAVLTVAAAASLTFGLIGISQWRVRRIGPLTQSLVDASFLIYLLHHPVVGLAHITARFALPSVAPELKVVLVTSVGVGAGWSVSWLAACRRQRLVEKLRAEEQPQSITFPRPTEAEATTRRSKAA